MYGTGGGRGDGPTFSPDGLLRVVDIARRDLRGRLLGDADDRDQGAAALLSGCKPNLRSTDEALNRVWSILETSEGSVGTPGRGRIPRATWGTGGTKQKTSEDPVSLSLTSIRFRPLMGPYASALGGGDIPVWALPGPSWSSGKVKELHVESKYPSLRRTPSGAPPPPSPGTW